MDILFTVVLPILSMLMAGGGVWTLLAARATARATKDAALAAAEAANKQAATADWSGLMTYWQAEVKELRSDNKKIEVRLLFLEQQREDDLQHIADLEHHIWQQLPPPPPMRRPSRINTPEAP
jgi:hypothetical protein